VQGEDAFLTVAEFAIALAGFTSVVVIFSRGGGEWAPADRFRIRSALLSSLGAGLLALLPSCLVLLGLSGTAVWRLSSFFFLVFLTVGIAWNSAAIRQLDGPSREFLGSVVPRAMAISAYVALALQGANVLGIGFEPQPGLVFVGLLHQLAVSVVAFTRTVFLRPGTGAA
jgi:hypothetical protein